MEVSSFELVYKPQAPVPGVDTVLQGYFLNITNLEAVELTFRVDFVTSPINDANRTLFDNAVGFIDTPNLNNVQVGLIGVSDSPSFRLDQDITIPAKGTAKVALLPSDPFPPSLVPPNMADFETRGYVTLRLPGEPFPFGFQLDHPARVLLTPQNRATYFDSAGAINAQTQSGLPTRSGAAIDEVEPEFFPFDFPPFLATASTAAQRKQGKKGKAAVGLSISDDDLAMIVASAASTGIDMKKINKKLKKSGVGMAIERRKS